MIVSHRNKVYAADVIVGSDGTWFIAKLGGHAGGIDHVSLVLMSLVMPVLYAGWRLSRRV